MRSLLKSIVLVSLLLVAGCKEPQTETNTISGKLSLFLHRQSPIGLYVQFELKEHGESATLVSVASSGFEQITEHPIHFSLPFPPEMISQQSRYILFATVAEDQQGEKEITSMSSPVLTQGHPSILNMVMRPASEPIE